LRLLLACYLSGPVRERGGTLRGAQSRSGRRVAGTTGVGADPPPVAAPNALRVKWVWRKALGSSNRLGLLLSLGSLLLHEHGPLDFGSPE